MNRADLLRWHILGKALTAAAADALNQEGRAEWEDNQARANWETRGLGTAFASISAPGLEVTDEQAFNRWLWERYPSEMVAEVKPRNAEWYRQTKAAIAQGLEDGELDGVPGVKLDAGGEFQHVSVKPDGALKSALTRALRTAIAGDFSPLQQLLQEAGYASAALGVAPVHQAITGGSYGAAQQPEAANAG